MNPKKVFKLLNAAQEELENKKYISYDSRVGIYCSILEEFIDANMKLLCLFYDSAEKVKGFYSDRLDVGLYSKFENQRRTLLELDEFRTYLDNQFEMGINFHRSIYAGYALWSSAMFQLTSKTFPRSQNGEIDLDIEDWDPPFFACLAYCGETSWEQVGDSGLRKEFWSWYLEELKTILV
ncbi:MAG: hypothetical protein KDC71_18745 [Acidobacteria bacterium]|nr:hypothetical protein [Acidobacteriota bacterium]